MFLTAIAALILITACYWGYRHHAAAGAYGSVSRPLLAVLICALCVLAYAEYTGRVGMGENPPVLVTLAVDLSLSMGAMPHPSSQGNVGSRMQRARNTLMPVISALAASNSRVMMSVTGFTATSEAIVGWSDDISQVREVVEHVLAPDLLTEPGSDIGAALEGVVPLFDNLPAEFHSEGSRKFLILVSDGERTVQQGELMKALGDLRSRNVNVVALQVGLVETAEGLPVYDDTGQFLGFRRVGGQVYTTPDPDRMSLLAGSDAGSGLYVKAESSDAADRISEFIGVQMSDAASNPEYLYSALALTVLGLAILLRFV